MGKNTKREGKRRVAIYSHTASLTPTGYSKPTLHTRHLTGWIYPPIRIAPVEYSEL